MENYLLFNALLSQLMSVESDQEFMMLWTSLLALKPNSARIQSIRLHALGLPTLKNSLNGKRINLACMYFLLAQAEYFDMATIIKEDIENPQFDHESQILTRMIFEAIANISDMLFAVAFRTKKSQSKLMEWIQIRDTDGTLESMVRHKLKSEDSMLILNQVKHST